MHKDNFDLLLSLPPNMCRNLKYCEPEVAERSFSTYDPPGCQLGSGGGTAYVLEQAWKYSGEGSFHHWLQSKGKLVIHGGGESRRLPAYAPSGKLFIPMPVFRWSRGQRLNQTLLDLAEPILQKLASKSLSSSRVMVASGDVLILPPEQLPEIPEADVILFGLWVTPETASKFGVMFCKRENPEELVTFLQKPTPDIIREKSRNHSFLIDAGIWLLSESAVASLMMKCGWNEKTQVFSGNLPESYDLYGGWALSLGENPVEEDSVIGELTTAVVPLADADFYHFGTNQDLIQSLYDIQNLVSDQSRLGAVATLAQPRQFIQNSDFKAPLDQKSNQSIWVENSSIPYSWKLGSRNVITGIGSNNWAITLADGVCLDIVPVGGMKVIRNYGFSDSFRGELQNDCTLWMGVPFLSWLDKRGITLKETGLNPEMDIQTAPVFPVVETISPIFLQWLISTEPVISGEWKKYWLSCRRVSARFIAQNADLRVLYSQRKDFRIKALPLMASHVEESIFYNINLETTAVEYAESSYPLPEKLELSELRNPEIALHNRMFRSAVLKNQKKENWKESEKEAFQILRDMIVTPLLESPVIPRQTLLDDQIVWGRSPVRLDFAGGWSDTPPYCIEHGGSVLNIAVDLNGQPPIQVFGRKSEETGITIRSIDLGLVEVLHTYQDIKDYENLGNGFVLARAAFAIAGFHPDFNGSRFETLKEQLDFIGGGIEISMLAAVPKGSGLGTSSILGATILGVLSDMCGLGWGKDEISQRTMALEQLLTSGGGWQDQVGAIYPGVKLAETHPGLVQKLSLRWLPDDFFTGKYKSQMLLYYTGITRVAHDILGDIVRGIFLNSESSLNTVRAIAANADYCHDALHRLDFQSFSESIRRSWDLNRKLDAGTEPEEVKDLLKSIESDCSAVKLLGAGGGGYLFIIACDQDAAIKIKNLLESNPLNKLARFVDFSISKSGMKISRS